MNGKSLLWHADAMHYTIEMLLNGRTEVFQYYARATEIWNDLLARPDCQTPEGLGAALTAEQTHFESGCGGRIIGQEIMAVAGIAMHYATADGFDGREQNVQRVREGIRASFCSIEVKGHADRAATSYRLGELD